MGNDCLAWMSSESQDARLNIHIQVVIDAQTVVKIVYRTPENNKNAMDDASVM